jgi:hypothetical protein
MDKSTDIGYYIYNKCKNRDCAFFPVYNKYIGWYGQFYKGAFYSQLPYCEGCKVYAEAKESLKNEY